MGPSLVNLAEGHTLHFWGMHCKVIVFSMEIVWSTLILLNQQEINAILKLDNNNMVVEKFRDFIFIYSVSFSCGKKTIQKNFKWTVWVILTNKNDLK